MIRNGEASLDAAAARLQQALDALEARLHAQRAALPAAAANDGEIDALHAELREKRLRQRALEAAAAEASQVLGRAAEQIRTALEDEDGPAAALSAEAENGSGELDGADSALDELSDDQTDLHPTGRPSPSREF
jgi:predicted  nucleic acid-binding Zn-ribbon protein